MSFSDLGLVPPLADSLAAAGLVEPTSVQRIAIPALLGGVSAIVVARTGSGKTLAYSLPLLQRLHAIEQVEGMVKERGRPRAIVLTATRELVDQTMKAIKGHAHALKARVRAASGGLAERAQRLQLADPADVIVANPPRLVSLLKEGLLRLDDVRLLVVDEADTLLAPGQRGDIDRILAALPPEHSLALISATLPEPIRAWAMARPEHPVLLLSKDAHSAPESVSIQNIKVKPVERLDTVHDTLVALAPSARGILFCNRRETADQVGATLRDRGHSVVVIHGALEPNERKSAMKAFRAGEGRVLVTTELGGRGLHLDDLAFVLNYELPEKASEYLHRIGRVGRQGAKGKVINLVTDADAVLFKEIERLKGGGRLDTGERLRSARDRGTTPDRAERAARAAAMPPRGKKAGTKPATKAAVKPGAKGGTKPGAKVGAKPGAKPGQDRGNERGKPGQDRGNDRGKGGRR
ncbi:MAG: DEAD/DEAH box helicase [Pseudomonadota bacterium]|nr:DEAD/DEAH box helicase [Pseudomonadota bacterium]